MTWNEDSSDREPIHVSQEVHEELDNLRRSGESFEEFFIREFDIVPEIAKIIDTLSPCMGEAIHDLTKEIKKHGYYEISINGSESKICIDFIAKTSGLKAAEIEITGPKAIISVRDSSGDLVPSGSLEEKDQEVIAKLYYSTFNIETKDFEELISRSIENLRTPLGA